MIERDDTYWEYKIQSFLHDPVDKALAIPGHETRAKRIAEAFGTTTAEKNEVTRADMTAAGIDRARLPKWDSDPKKNGAVDFKKIPVLTHPLARHALGFTPVNKTAAETTEAIVKVIEEDTETGFRNRKDYFNYLFFGLRKSLIGRNTAGLGFLWDHLPADTRIPDHSIWTHCSLVSALKTCFSESPVKQAAIVIFAITPVQPFIEKSRKLRDYWVGSILLSWLAFEGIREVMELLGPDHILYPSLNNQPLVKAWLSRQNGSRFKDIFREYEALFPGKVSSRVASLPNKFVFLAPAGNESALCDQIQRGIESQWKKLCSMVLDFIMKQTGETAENIGLQNQFNRQTGHYWNLNFSFSKLVSIKDQNDLEQVFKKEKFETLFQTIKDFMSGYQMDHAVVYPASHSLSQSILAAAKNKPTVGRKEEPGEKCPVCGEFEILHGREWQAVASVSEYREARDSFWNKFNLDPATLKENERICGLCSVKRFAPRAIREHGRDHLLYPVFQNNDFPSTTEMAAAEWINILEHQGILNDDKQKSRLIDELHECDDENKPFSPEINALIQKASQSGIKRKEQDKYYAILVMDGDKMGDLINGRTLSARWQDVLHPDLAASFGRDGFPGGILERYLDQKRLVAPAVHAAISEALGNFSLYAVPWVVNACGGRLVYAGGDDIAAILPLSQVMTAAERIRRLYRQGFVTFTADGIHPCNEQQEITLPFSVLPGNGEQITISGGILICHHKQPLRGAIEEAHKLLTDIAKKTKGRNAFAVKLQKRSGHSRIFAAGWDAKNPFSGTNSTTLYESFREIMDAASKELISASMIYRLSGLSVPVLTTVEKSGDTLSVETQDSVIKLLAYEITHSGMLKEKYPGGNHRRFRNQEAQRLGQHLAGLLLDWDPEKGKNGEWTYHAHIPEMAVFLSKGGMK